MLASQQVINRIVEVLQAASTVAGARVHADKFHPLGGPPATIVTHVDENLQAEPDDVTWPPSRLHDLAIDISTTVQAVEDLDIAMSEAVAEVLAVLEGEPAPLAPLPVQLRATGISYAPQHDGAAATGKATVRMQAQFSTRINDPHTLI